MVTKRTEDYLKTIEELIKKKGYAKVKDIAKSLNVTSPTVTEMLQKLDEGNYINYEKYSGVTLTSKGKNIAKRTKEKYDIVKDFLLILGVEEEIAAEDACKIEHILASETLDVLTKFAEFVHIKQECPIWLDYFKYFCQTGEYIQYSPVTRNEFHIHEKNEY